MAHIVNGNCTNCGLCTKVCPVNAFLQAEDMVVIDADVCIDCGVCELECNFKAIQQGNEETINLLEINKKCCEKYPNLGKIKQMFDDK